MRKITAGLFISLDGVVESPEQWHFQNFNDEMGEIIGSSAANADAILLGRVTYEEFAGYWPQQGTEDPMAAFLNNTPKYVVSTTLDQADWNNSTLIKGDVVAELTRLKEQPGKDINIIGSPTLVDSLVQNGLLDELVLLVHPVVVSNGKRLFRDGGELKRLKLTNSKTLSTGVLALTYTPASEAEVTA